jgi:asparagine synthase (glutamine-hydrolysing)
MLSGGLDTSSIVAVANHLLSVDGNGSFHTFSAVFPSLASVDPRIDERFYIEAVLSNADFVSHYIRADHLSPLVDIHWQEDEPIAAPNLYIDHAIFTAANQASVRIVLSGFDGDSIVSYGYELLPELVRSLRLTTFFAEVTALSQLLGVRHRRVAWNLGFKPLIPSQLVDFQASIRQNNRNKYKSAIMINEDFSKGIGLTKRIQKKREKNSNRHLSFREKHWQDLDSGLLLYATDTIDTVSAFSNVEVRFPFFDRRLIQFCLRVPLEYRLYNGLSRAIFRQAMVGILSDKVRLRFRKGNLSASFWLGLLEKGKDDLKVLAQELQNFEKYFDVGAIFTAYHRYLRQPAANENDSINLFLATVLIHWLSHWD